MLVASVRFASTTSACAGESPLLQRVDLDVPRRIRARSGEDLRPADLPRDPEPDARAAVDGRARSRLLREHLIRHRRLRAPVDDPVPQMLRLELSLCGVDVEAPEVGHALPRPAA